MQKALLLLFFLVSALFLGDKTFADCTSEYNSCIAWCPSQWIPGSDAYTACGFDCKTDQNSCVEPISDSQAFCEKNGGTFIDDGTEDGQCENTNKNYDNQVKKNAELKACKDANIMTDPECECIYNGGIKLNTSFPFLGRCINKAGVGANGTSSLTAVSGAFTNILMTLILTGWFAMIIWWGVQIAMGDKTGGWVKAGKQKIINVVIAFAALGSLGIILRLINPNFFK